MTDKVSFSQPDPFRRVAGPGGFSRFNYDPLLERLDSTLITAPDRLKHCLAGVIRRETIAANPELESLLNLESTRKAELKGALSKVYKDTLEENYKGPRTPLGAIPLGHQLDKEAYRQAADAALRASEEFAATPAMRATQIELDRLTKQIDTTFTKFEQSFFATPRGSRFHAFIEAVTVEEATGGWGSPRYNCEEVFFERLTGSGAHKDFLSDFPQFEKDVLKWRSVGSHAADVVEHEVSLAARTAGQTAERSAEGLWTAFKNMHWGAKTAIVGGTVTLGAILGYWAFRQKNEKSNAQADLTAIRS